MMWDEILLVILAIAGVAILILLLGKKLEGIKLINLVRFGLAILIIYLVVYFGLGIISPK